jgi:hypothetical protein
MAQSVFVKRPDGDGHEGWWVDRDWMRIPPGEAALGELELGIVGHSLPNFFFGASLRSRGRARWLRGG